MQYADSAKAAAHSAAKNFDTTGVKAVAPTRTTGGKLPETVQKATEKSGAP
jgi:hypothetical protein